jgi:hypothetical protein
MHNLNIIELERSTNWAINQWQKNNYHVYNVVDQLKKKTEKWHKLQNGKNLRW